MFRTDTSVGMLKAIALIAGLAVLFWSLGLPSLRIATAASLNTVSDTISDSAPSASANHDISFTGPGTGTGVPGNGTIVLDFTDGSFDLTGINTEDIDLLVDGTNITQSGNWTVTNNVTDITITLDPGFSIGNASTTRILIGLNATNEGSPDTQIGNPGSEGSYVLDITAGPDSATTHNVILNTVLVTASVDTVFTFSVSGTNAGTSVNGITTTGSSSTTTIAFGKLVGGAAATSSAQQLTVNTNASQGYVVTVQSDGDLESTTGGVIDPFTTADTPASWTAPTGDVDDATTWGHWGVTTDDATTTRSAEFGSGEFVGVSTTPRVVMEHDGPANGAGTGVGTTYVAYQVAITNLQEAGDDYSTTLTYIATPTF